MPSPTVKELLGLKNQRQLTEVFVSTAKEAEACATAGIEMIAASEHANVSAIRNVAPDAFLTVGLTHGDYLTKSEVKRASFNLLKQGTDAIYCPANLRWIEALSEEGIPAVGHVGYVPALATWTGVDDPVAQQAKSAFQIYKAVRNMRSAGAFAVYMERVPAKAAAEITKRSKLMVLSRGSGDGCDGQSLNAEHLLGANTDAVPSYAKAYRNHAVEYQRLYEDSISAFEEFKKDVETNRYPTNSHQADIDDGEFETFMYALEKAVAKKN